MIEGSLQMLGRYQLLAKLATGGMAEIYLARQTGIRGFERLVAVKKLFAHLAVEEKFLEMFFDEARIAANLNHPNIVQIYDLSQEEESYYIAMEYLEGESLDYMLRKCHQSKTTIPATLAAGIVSQVCYGLDYAHKLTDETGKPLGIVHRDVSPQNIIVLFTGGVKLVDFGIAKAASKTHKTSIGTFKGKLAYMSPEQCLGKPVDNRSDIFSLGTVLWELLTQRRLFKGDNKLSVMESIVSGKIPPMRKFKSELSAELESITLQALQKDPNQRFKSAKEMGAAIQGYLRRIGAAAGVQEIAGFVRKIFAERAQKKRKLIEAIRSGDTARVSQVTLDVQKPVTGDSSPSQPETPGVEETQRFEIHAGKARVIDEPRSIEPEPKPTPPAIKTPAVKTPIEKSDQVLLEAPTMEVSLAQLEAQGLDLKNGPPIHPNEPPAHNQPIKPETKPTPPPIKTPAVKAPVAKSDQVLLEAPTMEVDLAQLEARGLDLKNRPTVPHSEPPAHKPRRPGFWIGLPAVVAVGFFITFWLTGGVQKDDPAPANTKKVALIIDPGMDTQLTRLRITSKPPGCPVQIDANDIAGLTPIERVTVKSQTEHEVAVLCKGHRKESKRIKGLPGEEIILHFAPTRSKPEPKVTRPKPQPKLPKRKATKHKPRYGRLRMDTKPWSVVYIGKKKLGITPLVGVKLPVGTHKITAVNQEQGLKKTFKITIRPRKTTTISKKLAP